jgi:hypothetical protein
MGEPSQGRDAAKEKENSQSVAETLSFLERSQSRRESFSVLPKKVKYLLLVLAQ